MHLLINHQDFSGLFAYDAHIIVSIGVSLAEFNRLLNEVCTNAEKQRGQSALTTALVIVYLETKLSELECEWELIVEKARTWLERETDGKSGGAGAYLSAARRTIGV